MDASLAKRLWHMIRAVYYMVRKGLSKHKLVMELQLLLKRGKLAGKAIGNFVTFHHHHGHHNGGDMPMDYPNLSFCNPNEVEFSCSNTPSYPSFFPFSAKRKNGRHRRGCHDLDFAAIARQLEMLSAEMSEAESSSSAVASPSPALWGFGKSPRPAVRQLRITDSPFPIREEDGEADRGRVDQQAEEFIKRFYEQLRRQQSVPPTPEHQCRFRKPA